MTTPAAPAATPPPTIQPGQLTVAYRTDDMPVSLADAILADPSLPATIPASLIRESLDPTANTGLNSSLAMQMADAARAALGP